MKVLKSILMSNAAAFVYACILLCIGAVWIESEAARSRIEHKDRLVMVLRGKLPFEHDGAALLLVSVPHDEFYGEYKAALEDNAEEWAKSHGFVIGPINESIGDYGAAILIQLRKAPGVVEHVAKRFLPPVNQGALLWYPWLILT